MIYVLEPEIFDHFPDREEVDFALDVFPALLERDVPFGVHVTDAYWNDVGSLPEYLQGNLDVLTGAVDVEPAGELVDAAAEAGLGDEVELERPGAARRGREVGDGAAARRPAGDRARRVDRRRGAGARVGAAARRRGAGDGLLAGAIAGNAAAPRGIACRRRRRLSASGRPD